MSRKKAYRKPSRVHRDKQEYETMTRSIAEWEKKLSLPDLMKFLQERLQYVTEPEAQAILHYCDKLLRNEIMKERDLTKIVDGDIVVTSTTVQEVTQQ